MNNEILIMSWKKWDGKLDIEFHWPMRLFFTRLCCAALARAPSSKEQLDVFMSNWTQSCSLFTRQKYASIFLKGNIYVSKRIRHGIGPAKPRTLTCPKSPAFALKNRVRIKEDIVEPEESKSRIIHARPIHHVGVPFKPQTSHKTTDTQPFSFEQRDKEIQARKEAKIQEIYQEEEKARLFKAKPILEPVSVPEKKVKPVTKPEPFHLSNEEQGAKRAEMWSKKIEEELKEQRGMATAFKAKPADVVYNEPFVPQKSNKPLIEINPFNLNTDRRAVEREEFEEWKLKKELQDRESRYQQEKLKEEEERKEVERMRREDLVYRAKPIKHYKPVHVMPSLKPLTDACSPNFSDRFQK